MSIVIEFLGPIGLEPINIQASSLDEVSQILNKDTNISKWLQSSAIAVNDEIITNKNHILKDGDKISILPPVCGG
jgi:molybdopterin synthase sulfur carrier subunit